MEAKSPVTSFRQVVKRKFYTPEEHHNHDNGPEAENFSLLHVSNTRYNKWNALIYWKHSIK